MAYGITDFTRVLVAYTSSNTTVYNTPMRHALIGAFTGVPAAATGSNPEFPIGWRKAHIWATASTGVTNAPKLRKKFPINANVAPPTNGTTSTAAVDGVTWTAQGFVGERERLVI
jgi:hypothetical protein